MSRRLAESELILNPDGSIYHLNLKPDQVAPTVITVGDPDRVGLVTQFFDKVEFSIRCREFKTATGSYKGKRITVLSTGIGTDNIDIVFNELDALVNVDFKTRRVKEQLSSLNIIRIGTSGSIQPDIPVDTLLISEYAIGLDCMLQAYDCDAILEHELTNSFVEQLKWDPNRGTPYTVQGDTQLLSQLNSKETSVGFTATLNGFYGPQSRVIRLAVKNPKLNEKLTHFRYKNLRITNLEMETAGIYGLSNLLGHSALSMNAILANRVTETFSEKPAQTIEKLIVYTLDKLATI